MSSPSLPGQPHSQLPRDFSLALLAILALFAAIKVEGNDSTYHWQTNSLFLLLALVMTVLFRSYRTGLILPAHPAILWFSGFLGWTALSMAWSPATGESYLQVLVFSSGLLAMLLAFWANDRQWRFFQYQLIALGLLVIVYTSYQAFKLNVDRPSGFFLNWNTNSAFLGLILLPSCAMHLLRVTQGRSTFFMGLFLACCTFAMALGQGRGSFFVLAIGLTLLFFAYRTQARANRGILLTLAWIIAGYALADLLHGGGLLSRRVITTIQATNGDANDLHTLGSGREYLWAAGWHMYLDRPWLGWGINIFHWLYPLYRPPQIVEYGQYVHNDYLQFLIELGPIGLLLCLCWVVSLLLLGWRLFRSPGEAEQRFNNLAIALACAAMLLHTFVDFHLYQPSMLILLGAYAGRLCRQQREATGGILIVQPREKVNAASYYGILSVFCLFLGFDLATMSIGMQAMSDDPKTPLPVLLQQCEKAQRFTAFIEFIQSCQGQLILNMFEMNPDWLPMDKRDKLIHYGLQSLDVAIQNNPLNYNNHNLKAKLLLLQSNQDEAIGRHLRQSLALDPYQLDARLTLANYLEKNGKTGQAQIVMADGLNKAYLATLNQISAYWNKIDQYLPDTPAFAKQKQMIQEQKKLNGGYDPATRDTFYAYSLPDIGWNPKRE